MKNKNAIKILLADDDTDDRSFFEKALTDIEMNTLLSEVRDGEQLIEYLNLNTKNLPDILFLDLSMPRKTGFECLSEIRENGLFNNIYIVMFSTSYTKDKEYEQGMIKTLLENGAQHYIRKPNDLKFLKEEIQKVLAQVIEKKKNNLNKN